MTIYYALFENNLTSDPNDYMAMVQPVGTADLDTIIDRMVQQGSTVTKADILSVLEDFFSAVESILLEGNNVTTPLVNFSTSIKGVFNGQLAGFDASQHRVRAIANPGPRLRNIIAEKAVAEKKEAVKPIPSLLTYTDVNSESHNSMLTPSGLGYISGHRLKFDPADDTQGIFFVANDGTAARVSTIGRNKPAELIFIVPADIPAGDYKLEVRALFNENDIRVGTLASTLTVS